MTGFHAEPGFENSLLEVTTLAECASSHPIAESLRTAYGKEIDRSRVSDIEELGGHGVTAVVDGRRTAAGSEQLMEKLGIPVPPVSKAGTVVYTAVDGIYAGYLVISDTEKETAREAVHLLRKAGAKKIVMLTGDAPAAAEKAAASIGVDEVKSRLLPEEKVREIEKLLSSAPKGARLAFVGDGINDSPVLTRADVGIAMGAMGSDAAIEAADIVLMDDDPLSLVRAVHIARKCLRIVHENIVFALAVKFACLALGAFGIANMWSAIFADVGVMILAVLNALRAIRVCHL